MNDMDYTKNQKLTSCRQGENVATYCVLNRQPEAKGGYWRKKEMIKQTSTHYLVMSPTISSSVRRVPAISKHAKCRLDKNSEWIGDYGHLGNNFKNHF
jgi:hypothetical protein